MVKTPKMRHTKSRREPVTIELEPGEVSRVASEQAAPSNTRTDERAESETDETMTNEVKTDEALAEEARNTSQPVTDADQRDIGESGVDGPSPDEEAIRDQEADFEPWEQDEAAAVAAEEAAEPIPATADEGPARRIRPGAFDDGFEHDESLPPRSARETAKDDDGRDAGKGPTATPTENGPDAFGFGKASPTAAAPERGMNGIVAGLVGGVIALVVAGVLQFAGLLGAPGYGSDGLDGVNSEIASLKTRMAALSDTENGGEAAARVKGLSDALDQVKADVAALKTTVEQGGGEAGLAALGDKVAAIETAVEALGRNENAQPVDLAPLNEKLAALDALVKSTGDAAGQQEGRLAGLEQSMSQLSAKVEAQAAQPKIAMAIAASALKAALDRGAPFAAELDTFAAIAPEAPQIAALRAYAEKGVPTRVEIAADSDAAATAMTTAEQAPANDEAGFLANLLSSAESLVKVRPIGAVEGTGVPETVARLEVAVDQGDYARALAEYETLPEEAKAAGAGFADKLKARIEVEAQIDALISAAMKA